MDSLPPFLNVPRGIQVIEYLLRENITLVQPGLVRTADGRLHRLRSGPPDSREEYQPNDSFITEAQESASSDVVKSTEPIITHLQEAIYETTSPNKTSISVANMSLPIFLAVVIILINLSFIIWILYQFVKRKPSRNPNSGPVSYLRKMKEKLEQTTPNDRQADLNSMSDNDWMYMTSDNNTENELDNPNEVSALQQHQTGQVPVTIDLYNESDPRRVEMYSRNLRSLVILVTLAFHIALLSIVIASIQLYLISAYLRLDVIANSLSHRVTCIVINPMTSFTMLCARFYLMAAFILTSYIISFGVCCCGKKNLPATQNGSMQKSSGRLTIQQHLVYLSLTHSLPWMLAAGCSLLVIILPLLSSPQRVLNNSNNSNKNFIVNYYPIIERMFNCSQTHARPITQTQPTNIQLIVILVMIPIVVEILLCLAYLFREVNCRLKRVSFFLLIINVFISPGLSTVSNICCEMIDFIQNKLPLLHLMTDPIFLSIILSVHFGMFRKFLNQLSATTTIDMNGTVNSRQKFFFNTTSSAAIEQQFAEYPPAGEVDATSINCANMCLPIQFSQASDGIPQTYLFNSAQFQRNLVPLLFTERPPATPITCRIPEETDEESYGPTGQKIKETRVSKSSDSLATAALLSATAAAISASANRNAMPLDESSQSAGSSCSTSYPSDSHNYPQMFISPQVGKRSN